MTRLTAGVRLGAALASVALLAACSDAPTRTTGPQLTPGDPSFALSVSSSNFQQCANGGDGGEPCVYINGVLNDSKSLYHESDVIAERFVIPGLTVGHTYRLVFDYGWEKAVNPGHMNYDFIAGWDVTLGALANPCGDPLGNGSADIRAVCNANNTVRGTHSGANAAFQVIPDGIFTANAPLGLSAELQAAIDRFQTVRGANALRVDILGGSFPLGAFDNVTYSVSGDNVTGRFTVRFIAGQTSVMLLWGGHFADSRDYRLAVWDDDKNAATAEQQGNLTGAAGQSGAPFHFTQQYIKNLNSGDSTGIGSLSNNVQGSVLEPVPKAQISMVAGAINGIGEAHTFTVTLTKDLDNGAGPVPASGEHVDVTLTPSGGAVVQIDAAASTCDNAGANTNASGQCTITFTSNSAGTVTGTATSTLLLNGTSVTVSTDGSGGNTAPVVKVFVAGSLRWLKHDGSAVLLGGAVFTVCRTERWDSDLNAGAGGFVVISPVCIDVTDNVSGTDNTNAPPADRDGTAGEFELGGLILGKYTIKEKTAPPGYILDPDTETASLSTLSPSATITTAFVNIAPDAFITIGTTATNSTGEAHKFTAVITAIPNGGVLDTINDFTITVSPAPSTPGSTTCTAFDAATKSKTCERTINSNVAGVFTANASASVTISGLTLTRDTDPTSATVAGPGGSGSAVKTYVAPNLVITKEPDQGDPGSTFTAPGTATFTIVVSNDGQGRAFNVVLTDQLLASLSWTTSTAGCSISATKLLTCQIGTLDGTVETTPGGKTSFTATVSAAIAANFPFPSAAANGTELEIDGNPDVGGGVDWETPDLISCVGTFRGCALDRSNSQLDNAFGQGAKEDSPVPSVVSGSIPNNKSDLHRFYVHSNRVTVGNEVHPFLYLAWERVNEPNGTTNMDFEFNQSTTLSANGITPVRTAGDFLIKYDLSQGGETLSMGYHKWVTSGACEANGQTAPCWGPLQSLSGAFKAEANDVTVTDNIDPGDRSLSPLTFGEASIDLKAGNIFQGTACVRFGLAYLKSRSSDSFTSELKDFIAPIPVNLTNCDPLIIPNTATATADNASTVFNTGQITVNVP